MKNAALASPEQTAAERTAQQSTANMRLDLAAVSGLAFAVRLLWIWFGSWVAGDSAWYLMVARNLIFHRVFSAGVEGSVLVPTAFRPPMYSAIIAALWVGDSAPVSAVLLMQAVLGAATVGLVYLIARDRFSRGVAWLAAGGMALAPLTGHFTAVILSETLFTFLLTLGVFYWGRQRYEVTGLVFGLAALTRVTVLPFAILLALLTLFGPWRSYRRGFLKIVLLVVILVSIWTVRNAVQFRRFIPVAAGGYGTNLLLGSLETSVADDVSRRKALLNSIDQAGGNQTDESEFDRVRLRVALTRVAGNPRRWLIARLQQYPRLFIDSGSYLFANDKTQFRDSIRQGLIGQALVRSLLILGNVAVFVLALMGIIAQRARFAELSHLILFPIFLLVIALPFWIEPRYGLPMMPLVAVLSAVGFVRVIRLWRGVRPATPDEL